MSKLTYYCSVIVLLLFTPSLLNAENWGKGPITLRDQHPLALLHLSPILRSPASIKQGELKLDVQFAWANTFTRTNNYLIDAETRTLHSSIEYGLRDDLDIWLGLPLFWRGGGVLDSPIQNWHDFFSLPNGSREKVDNNSFQINGLLDNGEHFEITDQGFFIGNVELGTKWQLTTGSATTPAWALIGNTSLPTSNDRYSHNGIDFEFSVIGSKSFTELYLYWGGSYIYLSDPNNKNLTFYQHRIAGFSAIEWLLTDHWSLLATLTASSGTVENISTFPKYSLYLDTGVRFALSKDSSLEFFIRENPYHRKGTTDVVFIVGLNGALDWT